MSEEEIVSFRSPGLHAVHDAETAVLGSPVELREALAHLRFSIEELRQKAQRLDNLAAWVDDKLTEGVPWWKLWERVRLGLILYWVNVSYKGFERHFLYPEGLDNRSWFKHVVYAPGLWTGYAGAVFPGLQESIDAKDYVNAVRWAGIIDGSLKAAAKSIA